MAEQIQQQKQQNANRAGGTRPAGATGPNRGANAARPASGPQNGSNAARKSGDDKAKGKKAKKRGASKPVSIGAIISVLLILIFVVFFALVYFDLLGVKDFVVGALGLNGPTNQYIAEIEKREKQLAEDQLVNDDIRAALDEREKEITAREADVAQREADIDSRQEALTQMQQLVEGLSSDIETMAGMLEKMDPKKAADAISGQYSIIDMARILSAMKADSAAKVLDNMQQEIAAAVISEMLRYTS